MSVGEAQYAGDVMLVRPGRQVIDVVLMRPGRQVT